MDQLMHFLADINISELTSGLTDLFIVKPEVRLHLSGADWEFISWGDPICDDTFIKGLNEQKNINFIVNNLYGHYYFLLLNRGSRQLYAGNSLFSILPLYYQLCNGRLTISENAFTVGRHNGNKVFSKRFLLESVLFNYPLFNGSIIEDISLLPSNSGIVIDAGGVRVIRHTSVSSLFGHDPVPVKKSAAEMTGLFLQSVRKYMPEESFFTALTGGFDGRTLTAAGRYHDRPFSTFCFGTAESLDLQLARDVASAAGLPFYGIELDDDYLRSHSSEAGRELMIASSGTATFSRAHYVYAAQLLTEKTGYVITGNFGSEIFRAMHIPGVVIAPNLHAVFTSDDPAMAIRRVWSSGSMDWLNRDEMETLRGALENDIALLPCFSSEYRELSRNMQFYIFVFEELFRKYFGSEMIGQYGLLRNRTPFLDIDFLTGVLKTGFSGIHSAFFEENPLKRYKGQLLYAHIIRRAFPLLGRLVTDRGHQPDDLLSLTGWPRLMKGYLRKQRRKRNRSYDPYAVNKAWDLNRNYYEGLTVNESLFDRGKLDSERGKGFSNAKARVYSIIYTENYMKNL